MSVNYSAGVFFGAFVARHTTLGDTLDAYVEKQGGTRAKTNVPGVVIDCVGNEGAWFTVEAKGSARSFGRNEGDCPVPALLTEDPKWRPAIEKFLAHVGARGLAIGWHFQGSVS